MWVPPHVVAGVQGSFLPTDDIENRTGSRTHGEPTRTEPPRTAGPDADRRDSNRRAVTTIATSRATAATSCAGRGKNRSFQFAFRMRNGSTLVAMPYHANS